MTKRKAEQSEIEYGIGFEEVDEDGIEPEVGDEEQITGLAADEENQEDDDKLIEEYKKESVQDKGGEQ